MKKKLIIGLCILILFLVTGCSEAVTKEVTTTEKKMTKAQNLLEGETRTFIVDDYYEYEVTLIYVDSTHAKFVINGVIIGKLQEGETTELPDGKSFMVKETIAQDYEGGVRAAEFSFEGTKIYSKPYKSKKEEKPMEEWTEEENIEYFEENLKYVITQNGVTFGVVSYEYKKINENYGKLKTITVAIYNHQSASKLYPDIIVFVDDKKTDKFDVQKKISLSYYLASGYSSIETLEVDLGIGGLGNDKEVKIYLTDIFSDEKWSVGLGDITNSGK